MMRDRWKVYDLGWEELKAFRARLWLILDLLNEIETLRDESELASTTAGFAQLRDLQNELSMVAKGVNHRYRPLLLQISTRQELAAWTAWTEQAIAVHDPFDHQWGDVLEIAEPRHQVLAWDTIVALHRIIERELRRPFRTEPSSEREVQDAFEALLIGKDVEYERELPTLGAAGGVRRPDFTIPAINAFVEIKLSTSSHSVSAIKDEVIADIVTYAAVGRRLYFIVYDRGRIADTYEFEFLLEHAVHACPAREVCVRVVKQ